MESKDTKKLEFFSLLATNDDLKLQPLVQKFNVSFTTLKQWRDEFRRSVNMSNIDKLIDLPAVIADKIIENSVNETIDKVSQITKQEELEIDEETGKLIPKSEYEALLEQREKEQNLRDSLTQDFKNGVNELRDLSQTTEDAAINLVSLIEKKIQELVSMDSDMLLLGEGTKAIRTNYSTKLILDLSVALANIRNAYFNRPTTNINVNQYAGNLLKNFRDNLKP